MSNKSARLELHHDIDSDLLLFQDRVIDSDAPVYVFVRLMYWDYYCGDDAPAQFHCEIFCASPGMVSEDEQRKARESLCCPIDHWTNASERDRASMLADHGICATLWGADGNNAKQLLIDARNELPKINTLFGFYMDRQQNAIGDSGWEFIKGEIGRALIAS